MNYDACLDCEAGLACITGVVEYDDAFMESRTIVYLSWLGYIGMEEVTELEGWRADTCPKIARKFV